MPKETLGVEVLTMDNKFFKRFRSVKEAAEFLGYSETAMYLKCDGNAHRVKGFAEKYIFKIIPKEQNTEDAIKRAGETEDETRRRLGLSPYGEWRNDEWIYKMVEKANAELNLSEATLKYGNYYEGRKKREREGDYTTDTQIDTRNWEL